MFTGSRQGVRGGEGLRQSQVQNTKPQGSDGEAGDLEVEGLTLVSVARHHSNVLDTWLGSSSRACCGKRRRNLMPVTDPGLEILCFHSLPGVLVGTYNLRKVHSG